MKNCNAGIRNLKVSFDIFIQCLSNLFSEQYA